MRREYSTYFLITIGMLFFTFCTTKQETETVQDKIAYQKIDNAISPYLQLRELKMANNKLDSVYKTIQSPSVFTQLKYLEICCWMNNELENYFIAASRAKTAIQLLNYSSNKFLKQKYLAEFYLQLGISYVGLFDFIKAYDAFFKGKQIAEDSEDDCKKRSLVKKIAIILYKQQQFELAKNNFLEEAELVENCLIDRPIQKIELLQEIYDNIGICYTKMNQYDSAKHFYLEALRVIDEYSSIAKQDSFVTQRRNATCKGVVFGNMAKIYTAKKQYDSAAYLYSQAIRLNTTIGLEKADAQICQVQLAAVKKLQKDWVGMYTTLVKLKKSLDTLPNTEARLGWLQLIAEYEDYQNNKVKAFDYYKNYIFLRDSLQEVKRISTENIITKGLKEKEQQLKIDLLEKDKQLKKLTIWIISAVALMVLVITFLVYRNFKRGKKNIEILTHLNNQVHEQQKETVYALQQLEISTKEKDRILQVVAHDLRNPIGGITALTESILEKVELASDKELIGLIHNAGKHSLHLINELLQTNMKNEYGLNLSKVELNQIINSAIQLVKNKAQEKDQTVNAKLPSKLVIATVDADKILRVLANLLSNAIKFSPHHSIIYVELANRDEHVLIVVKDSGMGIPENQQKQIFDMMGTARRVGTDGEKSYGLGLFICKQMIEAHNGKIWVESEEGKGSSFFIQLPV